MLLVNNNTGYTNLKQRDFKSKLTRVKEGHYIIIKDSIHQKYVTITNIYALNISGSKYLKQTLIELKVETDSNIIIVGDFNISLLIMDRIAR